jgi:hypothetical protein
MEEFVEVNDKKFFQSKSDKSNASEKLYVNINDEPFRLLPFIANSLFIVIFTQ